MLSENTEITQKFPDRRQYLREIETNELPKSLGLCRIYGA